MYELPRESNHRIIIVQALTKRGELVYTMLSSNISPSRMSTVELYHFYKGRQTTEAFFKTAKDVYDIKNLRTRSFHGIYAFLWMVFATHNLITWFRLTTMKDVPLEKEGVKALIKGARKIIGFVERGMK